MCDVSFPFLDPSSSVEVLNRVSIDASYLSRASSMISLNSYLSSCHLLTYCWLTYCDSKAADKTAAITVITTHFLKCLLAQDFMHSIVILK